MKLLISLFLLTSYHAHALIKIKYQDIKYAKIVEDIFWKRYFIPKTSISLVKSPCHKEQSKKYILILCLNKKGELTELSKDMKMISKSILPLQKMKGY